MRVGIGINSESFGKQRIFLDGVEQPLCFQADDTEGWVKRYIRQDDGKCSPAESLSGMMKAAPNGKPLMELIYGKVEIRTEQ